MSYKNGTTHLILELRGSVRSPFRAQVLIPGERPTVSAIQRKRMKRLGASSSRRMRHGLSGRKLALRAKVHVNLITDLELGHDTQARATIVILSATYHMLGCKLIFLNAHDERNSVHARPTPSNNSSPQRSLPISSTGSHFFSSFRQRAATQKVAALYY